MAYELLSTCVGVPGFARSECAAWVQAWGSIGAILAAIWVVHRQHRLGVRREDQRALKARHGHLAAIEAELKHCDHQCSVYLAGWLEHKNPDEYTPPAYRLPTIAYEHSLPPLIAEELLTPDEFGALIQFYVDALSFNRCLDILERIENESQRSFFEIWSELNYERKQKLLEREIEKRVDRTNEEINRAAVKALHVVSQSCPIRNEYPKDIRSTPSRLEPALAVIKKHREAPASAMAA